MACAQQLARAGHTVTLFERDDRVGGLLRYGIPDFKMEKWLIDRRMEQMAGEGVTFRTSVHVGVDVTGDQLREEFDAVVLSTGSTRPRDLPVPGRELRGIHFAMEFLPQQNKTGAGDRIEGQLLAGGKRVIILGGGDTGSDCLGTSNRQGAISVHQFELLPEPPKDRPQLVWPNWPMILRTSSSHEEGVIRDWNINTKHFSGDEHGNVKKLHGVRLAWGQDNGRPVMEEIAGQRVRARLRPGAAGPRLPRARERYRRVAARVRPHRSWERPGRNRLSDHGAGCVRLRRRPARTVPGRVGDLGRS